MRYVSPLEHLDIDPQLADAQGNLPKSVLSLARKRLLAEIDLSPTQTIWVGQVEMSKNDVLKWFEDLSGKLGYHAIIARDKVLTVFLEQHKLPIGAKFNEINEQWYLNDDFLSFISSYYKTSFNKILIEALEKQQSEPLRTLLVENPILMPSYEQESAWLKILSYLKDKLERFEQVVEGIKEKKEYADAVLKQYYSLDLLVCLNYLPDSFQTWRNDYCIALINLSGFSWNCGRYQFAQEVILVAQALVCSPRETQMVRDRIQWYEKHTPSHSASNTTRNLSAWDIVRIFFIILFVIRLLIAASQCASSRGSRNSYTLTPPSANFLKEKIFLSEKDTKRKKVLDSLIAGILARPSGANTPVLQQRLRIYQEELAGIEKNKMNFSEYELDKVMETIRLQDTIKIKTDLKILKKF